MTSTEHENYAKDLLFSLSDDHPETEIVNFAPNRTQSRNAAKAMTAILCHRLFKKSKHLPMLKKDTTYEWKDAVFNCRNIADRAYFWTNMRRNVADELHAIAESKAVAYLFACSDPSDTTLSVWALPEPLIYGSLSTLPAKEEDEEYTIQISTHNQRIERYAASPDLAQYFNELSLSLPELQVLSESREVDASVRRERKLAHEEGNSDDDESGSANVSDRNALLAAAWQQLNETGVFDPEGIADARERALSSIVRRRGQPAFRRRLLATYNGRCAISWCDVDAVLDAAHIVPYRGPETNHPANGLLLRTDIHTLFDLKLVSIDAATMTVLVSPELAGTCYDEYRGRPISVPDDRESQPSREALKQHRHESDL